jgi:hypothetical protein
LFTAIPNSAPTVNFDSPTPLENSVVKGSITPRVLATDDTGMGSYYIRLWKGAFESGISNLISNNCFSAPGGFLLGTSLDITCPEIDTTSLTDGKYVLSAQFLDGNIAWGSKLRNITIDNTPPTISIKPGFVGNETSKIFSQVSFKLYDAFKVDKYVLNGQTVDFTNNNWSDANFQNIKSKLIEGNNIFVLYDVAGNSITYEFTYDSIAPSINWQKQPLTYYADGDGFHVRPITTEIGTVKSVYINSVSTDNLCFKKASDHKNLDTKNTNCQSLWDSLSDGEHKFIAVFTDYAGNSTTSESNTFVIDRTKPTASISSPLTNTVLQGSFTIKGTVSDNQTGIDRIEYRINKITALGGTFIENTLNGNAVYDNSTNSFNFDANSISDGFYRLRVQAFDLSGNWRHDYIDIQVDNTAPINSIPQVIPPTTPETPTTQNTDNTDDNVAGTNTGENNQGGIGGEPFIATTQTVTQTTQSESEPQVEGESTPEVLQSSVSIDEVDVTSDLQENECFQIFGICWYWWLIPTSVLVAILYYYVSRRTEQ